MRFAAFAAISNELLAMLFCNVAGSFVLAATKEFRKSLHPNFENLVSAGFCGGLSIFANFSKYSVLALQVGDYAIFIFNTAANFTFCALSILAAEMIVEKIRQTRDEEWKKKHPILAFARKSARTLLGMLGGQNGENGDGQK